MICCENESRAGDQAETERDTIQGTDYPEIIGTQTSGYIWLVCHESQQLCAAAKGTAGNRADHRIHSRQGDMMTAAFGERQDLRRYQPAGDPDRVSIVLRLPAGVLIQVYQHICWNPWMG